MTQGAFDQLVQDRYLEAVKTHIQPNIDLIELQVRFEVLERGETIEVYASQRALIEQQAKEIERLNEELTVAEIALRSHGYRKDCDIPACNCGPQWNHGGHAEMRLREISDLLPYANGLTILQRIELLLKKGEHP